VIGLKEMIIVALTHLPDNEGSIEEILDSMITHLGKDKVCEQTNSMIISYNDHLNKAAVKNIRQKM